jgi:hypothetical protein
MGCLGRSAIMPTWISHPSHFMGWNKASRAYGHTVHSGSPLAPEATMVDKECSRCKVAQPAEAFGSRRASRDGLRSHCRDCRASAARAYRADHPETTQAYEATRRSERTAVELMYLKVYRRAYYASRVARADTVA